jgi:hypothetical protein
VKPKNIKPKDIDVSGILNDCLLLMVKYSIMFFGDDDGGRLVWVCFRKKIYSSIKRKCDAI